jgi:hypothetical protein
MRRAPSSYKSSVAPAGNNRQHSFHPFRSLRCIDQKILTPYPNIDLLTLLESLLRVIMASTDAHDQFSFKAARQRSIGILDDDHHATYST